MIQCPECKTSYIPERLGIRLGDKPTEVTVKCLVCGKVFEAHVAPVITEPAWWAPWRTRTVEYNVVTRKRS